MSSFEVKIKKINNIIPIEGADAIELAQVDGYQSVVRHGRYSIGDYALYIPEQAILPDDLIEELGLTGRLAGKEKNRVKAIKLRGALSQGLICQPERLKKFTGEFKGLSILDKDLSEEFDIHKWEPPIPVHMAGQVEGIAWIVKWPDLENIKTYPDTFKKDEPVVATEKIHGTNVGLCYSAAENKFAVYSKGLGGRGQALLESETNVYWRAVKRYNLDKSIELLCRHYDARRVAVFGEVYGKGVQDLHYGATEPAFAAFDVWMDNPHIGGEIFIDAWDSFDILDAFDIPKVPVLYRGAYMIEFLSELAEGVETVSGEDLHMREGLVVRPYKERSNENGRVIAKFVSPHYLLRKNKDATEYE